MVAEHYTDLKGDDEQQEFTVAENSRAPTLRQHHQRVNPPIVDSNQICVMTSSPSTSNSFRRVRFQEPPQLSNVHVSRIPRPKNPIYTKTTKTKSTSMTFNKSVETQLTASKQAQQSVASTSIENNSLGQYLEAPPQRVIQHQNITSELVQSCTIGCGSPMLLSSPMIEQQPTQNFPEPGPLRFIEIIPHQVIRRKVPLKKNVQYANFDDDSLVQIPPVISEDDDGSTSNEINDLLLSGLLNTAPVPSEINEKHHQQKAQFLQDLMLSLMASLDYEEKNQKDDKPTTSLDPRIQKINQDMINESPTNVIIETFQDNNEKNEEDN